MSPRSAVITFTGLSFRLARLMAEAMAAAGFDLVALEAVDGDSVLRFAERLESDEAEVIITPKGA